MINKKRNITEAMYDVRPVDDSGRVDVGKIYRVQPVVNLGNPSMRLRVNQKTAEIAAFGDLTKIGDSGLSTYPVRSGFGYRSSGTEETHLDGAVDELRISNIARSVNWILTEYNNQNSPGTFYSVGAAATAAARKMRLFAGFKIRLLGGKIILRRK